MSIFNICDPTRGDIVVTTLGLTHLVKTKGQREVSTPYAILAWDWT